MCGICGIIGPPDAVCEETLRGMMDVLRHRGPDDSGQYLYDFQGAGARQRVGLGHTRLSIIDLEGGHQPLSNEDRTVWVAFNGEIYNFVDLRAQLQAEGHRFRTQTDTEVLVHLYEKSGERCVEALKGMFAFALWDQRTHRLLLARDRMGQKPLLYARAGGRFVFASELKAILEVPHFPREVDPRALFHYLTYQYVPHPLSILRHVSKLPPAHYMVVEGGHQRLVRYWGPDFSPSPRRTVDQYVAEVRERLTEATRRRLVADVPLGAFLSGGIDSSITVGLMSKLCARPVKTFAIGFEEKKYDELHYARLAARHFRSDHQEFIVRPDIHDVLPKLVWHFDEPFADSSAIPTYYVSKLTREHVTVALTGDAGDECFAGYPRYKAVKLAGGYDRLPGPVRALFSRRIWDHLPASVEQKTIRRRFKRLCEALSMPPVERYVQFIAVFNHARKLELCSPDFLRMVGEDATEAPVLKEYRRCAETDFLGQTMFVDMMTYLPDDILTKVDIASMAVSLETRSPFLDHQVVELAASIPTGLKLRGLTSKYILKRAFADLLPREILRRGKMGFGVPIAEWFRTELSGQLRDVLLDPQSLQRGYFREQTVRRLIDEHTAYKADHGYRLWSLFMLELWHREFMAPGLPRAESP